MSPGELEAAVSALANNYAWTWSPESNRLFESTLPLRSGEHPLAAIGRLEVSDWTRLAEDPETVASVVRLGDRVGSLASDPDATPDVAYFSPEFGITDVLRQYSGGLGILAGDHLKAASDLDTSLCGVGLFYRQGFFRQEIDPQGQHERFEEQEPTKLGAVDTGVVITVPLPGREVAARVWRFDIGRIPLLLLDTDIDTNSATDQKITDRLYSGDRRHRLLQEMVLGVGGARALTALGWDVPVLHLNEGHAGFLILELLDREIQSGSTLDQARETIRPRLVFTTHTPVPAGIDRFEPSLIAPFLQVWADGWDLPVEALQALGHDPDDELGQFNMAALCLRSAGRTNGVSKLHGQVSRELFASIPGGPEIGSVTNGVHARTWVAPATQDSFDNILGSRWENGDAAAWNKIDNLDDTTVRSLRRNGAESLNALVRERLDVPLDPDALTVGFARRFATYKRATLLLRDPDRLATLLADDDRPIQFVFAGKAHPADVPGKALLQEIAAFSRSAAARGRFVFIPDYDVTVAQAMYAGCDVWLNNPIRPHEACGTSGEKSALNGGLNCSISDGWWDEMADGRNGWIIPSSTATDPEKRDDAESDAILTLLGSEIIPEFFADGQPWSHAWIDRMRDAWRTLGPQVTAGRMVSDYQRTVYQPALDEVGTS